MTGRQQKIVFSNKGNEENIQNKECKTYPIYGRKDYINLISLNVVDKNPESHIKIV